MNKFSISSETMVVTSIYIIEQNMPILQVSHEDDEEGGSLWQFHCGNEDYNLENMLLVRLDTIIDIDPDIINILSLPLGKTATRNSITSNWVI